MVPCSVSASTYPFSYQRCDQFIQFSSDKKILTNITRSARSSAVRFCLLVDGCLCSFIAKFQLPDFLEALQIYQSSRRLHSPSPSSRGSQSHSPILNSLSASKLRYTAYDPPVATPRLQGRKSSNSNFTSELSAFGSPLGVGLPELLAGGELALAASTAEFESEMTAGIGDATTEPQVQPLATHGLGGSKSNDAVSPKFCH